MSKGQIAVSIVPSLCLSPTLSLYFVLEIYIYVRICIYSRISPREYIEENRVTARVTNQISIRLQNTFLREYRRRTPGGTFTRRFVHVIDAHDRSKLAMGSSSIAKSNQISRVIKLFDLRISLMDFERKIKICEYNS